MKENIITTIVCIIFVLFLSIHITYACSGDDGWKDCNSDDVKENWEQMPHTAENFAKIDPPDSKKFEDLGIVEQDNYFKENDLSKCTVCANKYLQTKFSNAKVDFKISNGMGYSEEKGLCVEGKCLVTVKDTTNSIPSWASAVGYENGKFIFDPRLKIEGDVQAIGQETFVLKKGTKLTDQSTGQTEILDDDVKIRYLDSGFQIDGNAKGDWVDIIGSKNTYLNIEGQLTVNQELISSENSLIDYQGKEIKGKFIASLDQGKLMYVSLLTDDSSYKDNDGRFRGQGNIEFGTNGKWKSVVSFDNAELEYGNPIKENQKDLQHLFSGAFEVNFNEQGTISDAGLQSKESYYTDKINDLEVASLNPQHKNDKLRGLFQNIPFQEKIILFSSLSDTEIENEFAKAGNSKSIVIIGQKNGMPDFHSNGKDLALDIAGESIYTIMDGTRTHSHFIDNELHLNFDNGNKPSNEQVIAVTGKRIQIGDKAGQSGIISGSNEVLSYITNDKGLIDIKFDRESLALLAGLENDPNKFAYIDKSTVISLGDGKNSFVIKPDLGMQYTQTDGNSITLLSPINTKLNFGQKVNPNDIKLRDFLEENSKLILKKDIAGFQKKLEEFISGSEGDVTNAKLLLANVYLQNGNYGEVRRLYGEIASSDPNSEQAEALTKWIDEYDNIKSPVKNALLRAKAEFDMAELDKKKETIFGFGEGKDIQLFTEEEIKQGKNTPAEITKRTLSLLYTSGNLVKSTKEAFKGTIFLPSQIGGGEEEIQYRSNVAGAELILKYIDEGKAGTISEALEQIKNEQNKILYDYHDGAGSFLTTDQVYNEISNNPTIKAAIQAEKIQSGSNQISQDQIDQINIEMAKSYREKGMYGEALSILKPIVTRETIGYSNEQREAISIVDDIQGNGFFDLSDATKSVVSLETAGDIGNVFLLAGYGLAVKGGAAVIGMTKTGQQLLKATSLAKGSLGTSAGARIVSELAWEGVETGVGFVHPSLEVVAMALDGGPDADYYAKQALKDIEFTQTGKLHLAEGEVSQVVTVSDSAMNEISKLGGAQRIEGGFKVTDTEGHTFNVYSNNMDLSGDSFVDISTAKADIETLALQKDAEILGKKATAVVGTDNLANGKELDLAAKLRTRPAQLEIPLTNGNTLQLESAPVIQDLRLLSVSSKTGAEYGTNTNFNIQGNKVIETGYDFSTKDTLVLDTIWNGHTTPYQDKFIELLRVMKNQNEIIEARIKNIDLEGILGISKPFSEHSKSEQLEILENLRMQTSDISKPFNEYSRTEQLEILENLKTQGSSNTDIDLVNRVFTIYQGYKAEITESSWLNTINIEASGYTKRVEDMTETEKSDFIDEIAAKKTVTTAGQVSYSEKHIMNTHAHPVVWNTGSKTLDEELKKTFSINPFHVTTTNNQKSFLDTLSDDLKETIIKELNEPSTFKKNEEARLRMITKLEKGGSDRELYIAAIQHTVQPSWSKGKTGDINAMLKAEPILLEDGTQIKMFKIVYPHGTTYYCNEVGSDVVQVITTDGTKYIKEELPISQFLAD